VKERADSKRWEKTMLAMREWVRERNVSY